MTHGVLTDDSLSTHGALTPKRKEEKRREENRKEEKGKEDIVDFIDTYSRECPNLPQVKTVTDSRIKAIGLFAKTYTLKDWEEVCKIANNCDFLIGVNDRGWKADFDFLVKVNNAVKILEGKYLNNKSKFKTNNPFMEILEEEGVVCRDKT